MANAPDHDESDRPEATAGGAPPETGAGTEATRGAPFTQQLGRVLVAVIAVLFGVFAVVNSQYVEFHWIFGGTEVTEQGGERIRGGVPLILLLVASFVLGALAGWFATWRRGRGRRGAGNGA